MHIPLALVTAGYLSTTLHKCHLATLDGVCHTGHCWLVVIRQLNKPQLKRSKVCNIVANMGRRQGGDADADVAGYVRTCNHKRRGY